MIATAKGFVSANIHSPVSGKVVKIDTTIDTTGYKQPAVFIEVSGDEWVDTIDRRQVIEKEIKLDREAIINKCMECGIVGLGGATFPTHVKMGIPAGT